MNPELALINHVIKTKDIVSPLNADIDNSIAVFDEPWAWIKEYYTEYREVPPPDVFFDKFPEVDRINTEAVMEFYIEEVHKAKAKRSISDLLITSGEQLRDKGPFSVINNLTRELARLGRDTRMVRDLDLVSNADERLNTLRERIDIRNSGRTTLGVPSGIRKLDESFGGFMKGDFVVIMGWTGSLKSWLALYMALNAWKEGFRVLYFSLEMSGEQLGYRMDTLLGSGLFSHTELTFGGSEDPAFFDRYKTWQTNAMRDKHPFVVVSNEDLDEINQNTVLAKIDQWKPDLCIVDYHQLFDDASGATGETEKTKNLSKAFKRIAIRTGVPIVDITSVTQEKKELGNSPPNLSDMAWSKQLAYDSDLTLALCKHGENLHVKSRKTRRGKEFEFWLEWDVDRGVVKEISADNSVARKDYAVDGETGMEDHESSGWG